MTFINVVALLISFPLSVGVFSEPFAPIHGHTYSKCIFTIQGVPKYMTSINKVALPISFPLWVGAFLEPFAPIHGHTYSKCIFTIQGVPKYMTSINIVALLKKFFFVRWRLFGAFCENTYIYLLYVYFHHTGCQKKWKMPWNGLKIYVYVCISLFLDQRIPKSSAS